MVADKYFTQENLSVIDRIVRYMVAAAMIAPVLFLSGQLGWAAYLTLASVYFATTAICGFDPVYALFHASSKTGHNRVQEIAAGTRVRNPGASANEDKSKAA